MLKNEFLKIAKHFDSQNHLGFVHYTFQLAWTFPLLSNNMGIWGCDVRSHFLWADLGIHTCHL